MKELYGISEVISLNVLLLFSDNWTEKLRFIFN